MSNSRTHTSNANLFVTISLEMAQRINEAFIKPERLNRAQMLLLREFHQALERPQSLRSNNNLVTDRVQGVDCPDCEDGTPHQHAQKAGEDPKSLEHLTL